MSVRGFSELARSLNDHYGLAGDAAISRQQVFQWWKRATRNKSGHPFPRETQVLPASAHRPNREFDLDQVLWWARPGIPAPHGEGWRQLVK